MIRTILWQSGGCRFPINNDESRLKKSSGCKDDTKHNRECSRMFKYAKMSRATIAWRINAEIDMSLFLTSWSMFTPLQREMHESRTEN